MTALTTWALEGAAPRYATAPTPGRPNAGARIEAVARAMGKPLMPWQSYTARVATERLPDGSYAYQVVVVSVPRQSGKTTLLGAVGVERCMMCDRHGFFYSAQTGKDARARWDDLVALVNESPLRGIVTVRRAAGKERLAFPNGSVLQVFAPTPDSLHGYTPPTVCLDEAFAHSPAQGDALMGAIGPAQITLVDRQLWIVSTRGTAESTFLQGWIDKGMAGTDRVALFDWGADESVTDPYDVARWPEFHPALGLSRNNGITVEGIDAEAKRLPRSEFERAYLNRGTRTLTRIIAGDDWEALAHGQLVDGELVDEREAPAGRIVLTYDVAGDGNSATVVASWRDAVGVPQVKVVRWAPGVRWVAPAVAEWATSWNVAKVAAPPRGPVREVTEELRGLRKLDDGTKVRAVARAVVEPSAEDMALAWTELATGIKDRAFGHDGSPHLSDAVEVVQLRAGGESPVPSLSMSPGDISPLRAAMVGLRVLRTVADKAPAVRVDFRPD